MSKFKHGIDMSLADPEDSPWSVEAWRVLEEVRDELAEQPELMPTTLRAIHKLLGSSDPCPKNCLDCEEYKGAGNQGATTPVVIIESPYAGDIKRNLAYVRAAMWDCLVRGEAPYASHALYTQPGVLDDSIPEERELGINAGFAFRARATKTVVYCDLGVSAGMRLGIAHAEQNDQDVEYRTLKGWGS